MRIQPIRPVEATGLNCRNQNPDTSHQAFKRFAESGKLESHRDRVMRSVTSRPGKTAGELSEISDLSHVECQRRLSDLARDGMIYKQGKRKCSVKGSAMSLWWPCL